MCLTGGRSSHQLVTVFNIQYFKTGYLKKPVTGENDTVNVNNTLGVIIQSLLCLYHHKTSLHKLWLVMFTCDIEVYSQFMSWDLS
jgi:hypothetical protein